MLKDFSITALIAGCVSVIVGFSSSIAIIFQAAESLGATPNQTASWLWAIGFGMGIPTITLSLILKKPILYAWSVAGVAVVGSAAASGHLTMPQAIGCFLFSSLLIAISGFSGGFERVMKRLPLPLASALLAGVLARFALNAFAAVPEAPLLTLTMAGVYVLGRRFWPRTNVPVILVVGVTIAALQGTLHLETVPVKFTTPVWIAPEFSWAAILGTGVPLFIVTMASQNLPGLAALRVGGYEVPVSRVIGWSGVANFIAAPFGAFAVNLAAVTAAFCIGPDSHPDPKRRYWSSVCAGVAYLGIGVLGATVVALFAALPIQLVLMLAGLALLATIANGLASALSDENYREASAMTFFVTLSGITLVGIGSALWGIIAGGIVLTLRKRPSSVG